MTAVSFFAPGAPQPQGNKTAIVRGGRAVVVEGRRAKARSAFTEWRATVRIAAAAVHPGRQLEGPLEVRVFFAVPRPTSAPKTRRTFAVKRPDLDKYVRAVLDAIGEAAVWGDDAQVVAIWAAKDYPRADGRVGCWVQVVELGHDAGDWLDHAHQLVDLVERAAA